MIKIFINILGGIWHVSLYGRPGYKLFVYHQLTTYAQFGCIHVRDFLKDILTFLHGSLDQVS